MAAIPQPLHATVDAIYRWRERVTDTRHRAHLGASVIGHPCERYSWMVFRWCITEHFDGRVLRLFDTGKREEPRVHEELRGIGCEVHADDGTGQYRVAAIGGHFGGSMDGVARGLPEAPKAWHVVEIKTHSAKSFAEVQKSGVREAKPMHWVQMQTYMHLAGIDRALYVATNKDTDALYTERVEHDKAEGERILARAERVIRASTPPLRISEDPAWFQCRMCRFRPLCHGTEAPEANCRTCAHATPIVDGSDEGKWQCERHGWDIALDEQRVGCRNHRVIPVLLERFARPVDTDGDAVRYEMDGGGQFVNGEPPEGYESAEIRAAKDKTVLADPAVQALRLQVPSTRIV